MNTGTKPLIKLCDLVKNQHFWHKKTWLHAIARLFSIPTILICKKLTRYNFTAAAKSRRNIFSYSNTPKHAQNWLFWGIFSFFAVFVVDFLRILNPIFVFLIIKCGMKYAEWPIYATSVHKTELWKITKKRNCPPGHAFWPHHDQIWEKLKSTYNIWRVLPRQGIWV